MEEERKREKEEILKVWQGGNKALENNDWELYSNYWAHTDYIQIIHPKEREWLQGWDTIGPSYKKLIDQGTNIRTKPTDLNIHVSEDKKMAWLTCKIQIKIIMETENPLEFESWQTNIFEKIEEKWKLVHGPCKQSVLMGLSKSSFLVFGRYEYPLGMVKGFWGMPPYGINPRSFLAAITGFIKKMGNIIERGLCKNVLTVSEKLMTWKSGQDK